MPQMPVNPNVIPPGGIIQKYQISTGSVFLYIAAIACGLSWLTWLRGIGKAVAVDREWAEFYNRTKLPPKPSTWPYDATAIESLALLCLMTIVIHYPLRSFQKIVRNPEQEIDGDIKLLPFVIFVTSAVTVFCWLQMKMNILGLMI